MVLIKIALTKIPTIAEDTLPAKILAFTVCLFYSPIGMAMLRSLHYPPLFILFLGVVLGNCGTALYWATVYYDFSGFPWYKRRTNDIARIAARSMDFIHRYIPLFSVRKKPPVFAHAKPYAAITIAAVSDIWLCLAIARKHPDVDRWIVLKISIGVGTIKILCWNLFVALIAPINPFVARHLTAFTACAAITVLIGSEYWARWREKRNSERLPESNLEFEPEAIE